MLKSSKQITAPWRKISFILVFLGLATNCFLWERSILAQEESTESSQEDYLRREVEAIVRDAQESSSESDLEVKRAFCGNLKSRDLEANTLVVETNEMDKTITYDDETVFLGISKDKIKADDLELGSFVIAMGYVSRLSLKNLAAKRVEIGRAHV